MCKLCLTRDIDLQIKWLPREHALTQCADNDSKEEDPPRWALSSWHTELITQRWAGANLAFQQKRILDVFGDEITAKSKHSSHEARVIQNIMDERAGAVLIIQDWVAG
eukprot:jgi/Tetstr1/461420/TSEL_006530.t1